VALNNTTTCTGSTTFSTSAALTFVATITSTGSPTGSVSFYANGSQIGAAQMVTNGAASLTYTFATAGTYKITATYSGDSYFHTSTSVTAVTITSTTPSFTASPTAYVNNSSCVMGGVSYTPCISPGQTGLYSFYVAQSVYTGTITLACSGLPANSSCSFSPQSIAATGCSTNSTVALSILTQQGPTAASFAGPGRGLWSWCSLAAACVLALLVGLRRRSARHPLGRLAMIFLLLVGASGMVACSGTVSGAPATPAGTYNITVTATGSTGATSTFTVPLTVN
jgi:hypothetical protein